MFTFTRFNRRYPYNSELSRYCMESTSRSIIKLSQEERKNKISKIKQISESISQEVASTKLITKYPGAKLVGKTNKHNLVFEMDNKQLRVNTKGEIL